MPETPGVKVTLRPRAGDDGSKNRNFRFNAVFAPEQTQDDVWAASRIDGLVLGVSGRGAPGRSIGVEIERSDVGFRWGFGQQAAALAGKDI